MLEFIYLFIYTLVLVNGETTRNMNLLNREALNKAINCHLVNVSYCSNFTIVSFTDLLGIYFKPAQHTYIPMALNRFIVLRLFINLT